MPDAPSPPDEGEELGAPGGHRRHHRERCRYMEKNET